MTPARHGRAVGAAPPGEPSVHLQRWPAFDPELVRQDTVTMVVQVNGKVRDRLEVDAGISEADAEAAALASPKVVEALAGAAPTRVVVRAAPAGQHRRLTRAPVLRRRAHAHGADGESVVEAGEHRPPALGVDAGRARRS